MGFYTVQVGGEQRIRWWPGPTPKRKDNDPIGTPSIVPVSPATDLREGVTVALFPPNYSYAVTDYEFELNRYADGTGPGIDTPASAPPLATTTYSQVFGDPAPTYAVAIGTANTELSLRARAKDRGGKWSIWATSNAQDITAAIAAEFAPLFTVIPAVTGLTTEGSVLTCDGGTTTGSGTITKTYQWTRDGVNISGATAATRTVVNADLAHALACLVTATNAVGSTSSLSLPKSIPLVFPSYISRSQFSTTETSNTTGINGSIDAGFGTEAVGTALSAMSGLADATGSNWTWAIPGSYGLVDSSGNWVPSATPTYKLNSNTWEASSSAGAAISLDPDFTLHVAFGTNPDITTASTAAAYTISGSGTVSSSTLYADGTAVRVVPFYRHTATGQRAYAFDQSDTVTIGGATGPYGMIVVGGITATDPIAALGTPPSGYYSTITNQRAVDVFDWADVESSNSMITLGVGCLKGNATAITNAIKQLTYTLDTEELNPHMTAGFWGNSDSLFGAMICCMKLRPAVWNDSRLTDIDRNRATAAMKVMAITGALVMADSNPAPNSNPVNLRGYSGTSKSGESNQRSTAPNQALVAQAYLQIALAFFGGVAGVRAVLNTDLATISADILATNTAVNPRACDWGERSNLWRTLNWGGLGYTEVHLGTGKSSDVPAADDVQDAIRNNWRHFGHTMDEYHHLLAMMTSMREGESRRPWIADGSWGASSTLYAATYDATVRPVVIGYGWGGNGLGSNAQPTSNPANRVYGVGKTWTDGSAVTAATIPGFGLRGAPSELFAEVDGGKRASIKYTCEGMRPLIASWLCQWAAGHIDLQNADIQAVLPVMDRGVKVTAYFDKAPGSAFYKINAPEAGLNAKWRTGLFDTWGLILAPAFGLTPWTYN